MRARADTAREDFALGVAAAQAGDWTTAEASFERAWAAKRHYQIATNLGMAEVELGKFVEAAEHLREAVRLMEAANLAAHESMPQVRELLARSSAQVGAVEIATVDGATITVDGKLRGTAPLDGPIYLAPGKHLIVVAADGQDPIDSTVVARKGVTEKLNVLLTVKSDVKPEPVLTNEPSEDVEAEDLWPVVVLGGAGAVCLGVGIGLFVHGAALEGDADARRDGLAAQNTRCDGGCPELVAAYEEADAAFNGATGLMVVGGGLLALGIGYGVWTLVDDGDDELPAAVHVPRVNFRVRPGMIELVGSF